MNKISISAHARDRLETRLNTLVNMHDVKDKIKQINNRLWYNRKNYILIKKILYTEIKDDEVQPDGIARGDMVVGVIQHNTLITVILRKSWSMSNEYDIII